MDGVNNHRIKAVHVKRHALRASTPQIVVTSNAKETKIISAQLDPKKAATVNPVARRCRTK